MKDKEIDFKNIVVDVLKSKDAQNKDKAVSGWVILEGGKDRFAKLKIGDNNFYNWLTWLKDQPDSGVVCLGRRQGYFLDNSADPELIAAIGEPTPPVAIETEIVRKARINREELLYEKFANWLRRRGYRAGLTFSGKGGGKWGNPDVTGLNISEVFGTLYVEVATVEVKTSITDWNYWIFEAVSHRRFANRAYFAFAFQEDEIEKSEYVLTAMRYYAELYQVGILMFPLPSELYQKLQSGEIVAKDFYEIEDVIEICSAPYCYVRNSEQKAFFQNMMRISEREHLYKWGKDLTQ